MAVVFKKYVPKEINLETQGTVQSFTIDGSIMFTRGSLEKYLSGKIKSISMLLTDKKGDSTTMPLSKAVSQTMKEALAAGATKEDCYSTILGLNVVETEDGANIISAPIGSGGNEEPFTVKKNTKATTYESLLEGISVGF
jgi:hypothetical protein